MREAVSPSAYWPHLPDRALRAHYVSAVGDTVVLAAGIGDVSLSQRARALYDSIVKGDARARRRLWRLAAWVYARPGAERFLALEVGAATDVITTKRRKDETHCELAADPLRCRA